MTWSADALGYLRKHRDYVDRDLQAFRSGRLKVSDGGSDISVAWIARYERQIAHLERIIGAYESS